MKVKLENVRLSYPSLWEKRAFDQSDKNPAYSASFIFDKKHSAFKIMNAAIEAVALEKWEKKASEILKQLRAGDKICFRDGDTKPDSDGYAGNFFVSARNQARPLVIDRDKGHLMKDDGKPYGGCYVNASIDVWAQQNGFGKRINATLSGVQFLKDGDAFSGSPPSKPEDFDDLADGSDADDLV